MRGNAPPHNVARVTKPIEILRLVSGDATRQNLRFPCRRRNFVPLELTDDRQRSIDSVQAGAGRSVLPTVQEAREFSGRRRFDFTTKASDRQAMDSCQHAPVTPFRLVATAELSAQHLTLRFQSKHGGAYGIDRRTEPFRQFRDGYRPAAFQPSTHD